MEMFRSNAKIRTSESSACHMETSRSDTSDTKVCRCPGNNGDAQNAEDRSYCVHQGHEVTLLQSFLNSKGHSDHHETHGKEILTKGVVLKHIKAVATVSEREATFQNFFQVCESDEPSQNT